MGKKNNTIEIFIIDLLSKFEEKSLSYVVLRNYENRFTDLRKDLDLLINPADEQKIIHVIKSMTEKYSLFFNKKLDHKRTVISMLFVEEGINFTLDLNKYLTLKKNKNDLAVPGKGQKFYIKDLIVEKKKLNQQQLVFNVLNYDQEILFLLNHILSKKKDAYLSKINSYLKSVGEKQIKNIKNNHEIYVAIKVCFDNSRLILKRSQVFRNIKILLEFIRIKLLSFRLSKVIYFSGPDGSGKTTSIVWTMDYLNNLNIKYCRTKSLQLAILYFLNLREDFKYKKKTKKELELIRSDLDLVRDRDTGSLGWAIRRRIGLLVGIFEICIIGRIYIFLKRITGHVILVEESPVDIFVKRHRPRVKILEIMFMPLLPYPTTSILCVADENKIFARKPELIADEITQYYKQIHKLYNSVKRMNKVNLHTDIEVHKTKKNILSILRNVL